MPKLETLAEKAEELLPHVRAAVEAQQRIWAESERIEALMGDIEAEGSMDRFIQELTSSRKSADLVTVADARALIERFFSDEICEKSDCENLLTDGEGYNGKCSSCADKTETFEYCECGRDWEDCAQREGASVCMDRDDYLKHGEPKEEESGKAD